MSDEEEKDKEREKSDFEKATGIRLISGEEFIGECDVPELDGDMMRYDTDRMFRQLGFRGR